MCQAPYWALLIVFSFHPHNHLWPLFLRWGNWGSEGASNLSEVKQLVSTGSHLPIQISLHLTAWKHPTVLPLWLWWLGCLVLWHVHSRWWKEELERETRGSGSQLRSSPNKREWKARISWNRQKEKLTGSKDIRDPTVPDVPFSCRMSWSRFHDNPHGSVLPFSVTA